MSNVMYKLPNVNCALPAQAGILYSMEHIGKHMAGNVPGPKRNRDTERGELMKYFMENLNVGRKRDGIPPLTMPRMGRLLVAIPTKDLYYLKSVCDQSKDFSKKFWWEINPKKHEQDGR